MPLMVLTLACAVSACAAGPQISAQQKRAVAGILRDPASSTTAPFRGATTSTGATAQPATTSTTSEEQGSSPAPTSVTTTTATTPSPGAVPNVVGQSLSSAESRLQAAGYSTSAHAWAGSCPTVNRVMQQVPPQDDDVQLYYCAAAS
jgi:hypothetical protein